MGKQINEATVYARNVGYDVVFFYDSSNRQEYVCRAYPGAATNVALWQIYKISYDANSRQSKVRWADSTDDFKKVCDDYAGYNYVDI